MRPPFRLRFARHVTVNCGRLAARGYHRARSRPATVAAATTLAVLASMLLVGSLSGPGRPDEGRGLPPNLATKIGELPERSTATSTTRRNKDGSLTTTVYGGPVNYETDDGSMRRIDTRLLRTGGDYTWRSGANAFEARFGERLEAAFTELRLGGAAVRTTAVDARPVQATVDGSTITYPGAYPGADLTYTVTETGVKEVVKLVGPDSRTSYTFRLSPVNGRGLSALRRVDGSYQVGGLDGFVLDAPVVWEGDDATPAAGAKPSLRVEQAGPDLLVTLSLDGAWLRALGRRFPVHLDPTITVQRPFQQATWRTVPGTTGSLGISIGSDATSTYRAAMQFDLAAVPAGAQITGAVLGLYFDRMCLITTGSPCDQDHVIDLHRMSSQWSRWRTFDQLTHEAAVTSSYTLPRRAPVGWMTWSVTGLVSAWLNGTQPNYGVLLKRRTEVLGSNGPRFGAESLATEPKIDVTYTVTGPYLEKPTTLHADGAELSWTPSATGSGSAGYEVHRSGSSDFTPVPATLIATIGDRTRRAYRDTTAAADRTFTYRIKDLSDGTVSVARTVTLPPSRRASKDLELGADTARVTALDGASPDGCIHGADYRMLVAANHIGTLDSRGLLHVDLRDIPHHATVTEATLTLSRQPGFPPTTSTVNVHRVTRPWAEGGTEEECAVNYGASWPESSAGQLWTTPGGDYDPVAAASVTLTAMADSDQFPIRDLVQDWVDGSAPNHGLLLRVADEVDSTASVSYGADDDTRLSLRPRLRISYEDGSEPSGPRVALSAPEADARVGGQVRLVAAAEDDRRVNLVEFLVNGASVGSDAVAPFEFFWNSAGLNGGRTVAVRATDDAGNVRTSAPVDIVLDNTAAPTGALSAPVAGAVLSGDVTLSATASDDVGVASVAFLVDGVRVDEPDGTSPYSVTWKTLDPLAPGYNGSHDVAALITDTSGQQVTTPVRSVTVNNRGTSNAKVEFLLNDPASTLDDVFPSVVAANTTTSTVQDPYSGTINPDGTSGGSLGRALGSSPVNDGGTPPAVCPANAYCPTVTVVNRSGATWASSGAQVWYRWYAPNGAVMFEGRSVAAFPATFADGAAQVFPLTVVPPALPPCVEQGTYRLRIDVYDPATNTWFAAKGNPPLDNPVIVAKELATKMGFERYYQYEGEPVGVGMLAMTNIANGNLLWRWSPLFSAGRGLSTMVDLTYNSLEDHSRSPAGNNVSLSISGLIAVGSQLDIHPDKADEISGRSNKWVEFADGDGTVHRFTGVTGGDGITRWTEPAGVNLYLRSLPTTDTRGRWALTRPDKVTFIFDGDGYPTMVEDRNGNRVTFVLEETPSGEDPGGPKKRITSVTDPGGRSFVIDYWSKDEIKKAHVRGKVQQIRDHSGSRLDFEYYDDGNLRKLIQRGGLNANGTPLADRVFVFTYTTSNGAGPAIPDPVDRADPAEKVPNQSTRIFSIRDPRGAETAFAYYLAPDGQHLKWKLKSRTNRHGQTTQLGYDLTNRVTTVTAPLARITRYTYDVTGKVTRIVNPLSQDTNVEWSTEFKVTKVIEPTGEFTRYEYNPNGYLTLSANQLDQQTVLAYTNSPVDADDVGNHLSLLATVTRPRGVATATPTNDYQWRYTYDSAGNIDTVTDSTGAVTDYTYNLAGSTHPGTVSAIRDANDNPPTLFEDYHASGQPTRIRDPLGNLTRVDYNADSQVRWIQDPNHENDTGSIEREYRRFFDYDAFGRLGRQSAPKSTSAERGRLLWSSVEYDANDNVVKTIGGHYGEPLGDPEDGPVTTTTYDVMDRPVLVTGPDTIADPAGERIRHDYDDAGRLEKLTKPRGMQSTTVTDDFTTRYEYDLLDRMLHTIDHGLNTSAAQTRHTHACYDLAGDLRSVTSPRADLASVTCPGNGPATVGFTTSYGYDDAHRLTAQRDPLGHETRIGYDANGNTTSQERNIETGRVARTQTDFDQRDMPALIRQRFDAAAGRDVVTRIEYDANGNRKKVHSPRATDAAAVGQTAHYITAFGYDPLNRVTTITLPFDGRDGAERQYVHHEYDDNGNLLRTSLPVTSSTPGGVTDTARTVMEYFDPGWIRTSDDPANPKVHFDYTAVGQQAKRTPEKVGAPGQLDLSLQMLWTYLPDGPVATRTDRGGQSSTYKYDAHNNLTRADDSDGISHDSQKPVAIEATYTGFDEPAKTRFRRDGETVWTFSDYTYDPNGNTTIRRENGQENDTGGQTKTPRRYEMTYDAADWLTTQLDLGIDSACKDDQRLVNQFWGTGWEKQRDIHRAGTGCSSDPLTWPKKQTTTWNHNDNGLLRKLETVNPSGAVLESHDVEYIDNGIFINGNRTRDRYVLRRGQGSTATTCTTAAIACDAVYTYDARDRLISHQQRAGVSTTYALDQPGQLLGDNTVRAGNVTTETKGGVTTTRRYRANQLIDATSGGVTAKYWYLPLGELDCITTAAGSQANCSPSDGAAVSNLIVDHAYDYLSRLAHTRQYSAGSTLTDEATYVYDPLDRTVTEKENHTGTGNDRDTAFTYQGLTMLVTEEVQTGGTDPKTKTFSYDAYGHRIAMTDTNGSGTVETFTYGHDVHGSVSQLINDSGNVRASYGYDAYGGTDAAVGGESLTAGDTDAQAPLNPYRYTGKRMDSGQATSASSAAGYDMGARRYGPDFGRFLQQDMYAGALSDLGMSLDSLTQNRYALAGGNPISYIEYDGHTLEHDGGGGGSPAPAPDYSEHLCDGCESTNPNSAWTPPPPARVYIDEKPLPTLEELRLGARGGYFAAPYETHAQALVSWIDYSCARNQEGTETGFCNTAYTLGLFGENAEQIMASCLADSANCETTDLYRVSKIEKGDAEFVHGLNPENFPSVGPDGEIFDGAAHFGNEARVNDFASTHTGTHGFGYKVTVPTRWLTDNNIEIWPGMGDQVEYVIPADARIMREFNQFVREPWTPGKPPQ